MTKQNVLLQLDHLRTHPVVAAKLGTGEIDMHGWVYDIEHGNVAAYDDTQREFVSIEERYAALIDASAKTAATA